MKRLITICAITTVCMVGVAQADLVTFDFEALSSGDDAAAISTYMTGLYPSTVTVISAVAAIETSADLDPVYAPTTSTMYITPTTGQVDDPPADFMRISFDIPILSAQLDAGVFGISTHGNPDFTVLAYTADDVLVRRWEWGTNYRTISMTTPLFDFSSNPVTHLVFHNDYPGHIGVDNLTVSPVPVPGAILLGLLGLGAAGLKLRKYA